MQPTDRNLKNSMEPTRRAFLKTAGAGAVLLAGTMPTSALTWTENSGPALDSIEVWVTDDTQRMSPSRTAFAGEASSPFIESIVVDSMKKFQTIHGFGACFTDGSCLLLSKLPAATREELFHRLFDRSGMALNVCRTCIGSSDHSASLYSFDDGDPDPGLKRFSIDHDRAYILPMLREALSVNPDLFLFSSPWSPPGWMKDNNSMKGGCMRHTYMPDYANYFVRFIQEYEQAGVPIHAITVQNEVDADQQGLMPACFWPQDYEADFVSQHLGPAFERHALQTKIWIIDHNYNLWGRAIAELENPDVLKYSKTVAWHGYSGIPDWMMRVRNAFPQIEMRWTEGSPDHDDPEYMKCWVLWAQKFSQILSNGCVSVTGWCFATDERGGPNVGPYPLGGLMTIDSHSQDIYHSGQFWALEHYSRFIRRGSARVETQGAAKNLTHCAFTNPDGSVVVVITNAGPAQVCELHIDQKAVRLELTANSVTTIVDSKPHSSGAAVAKGEK
jgi:glucosylceramidase